MTPETPDGREGFIHAVEMNGGSSEMKLKFILRDFERDGLAEKGELLRKVCAAVQAGEPRATITCEIGHQYRNMRYWLEDDMTPVDLARAGYRRIGLEPSSEPIRGGTDGSRLTECGVPTPNLFTGMQNIHGPLEWISTEDRGRVTELCLAMAEVGVVAGGRLTGLGAHRAPALTSDARLSVHTSAVREPYACHTPAIRSVRQRRWRGTRIHSG